MGTTHSRTSYRTWTVENLVEATCRLGPSYQVYADAIRENAVDGRLLSCLQMHEVDETLDDLGVTNRLHRRVLKSNIEALREYDAVPVPDEFESFDEITHKALDKTTSSVFYCGLHLVPDSESLLVLSGKVRDSEEEIPRFQLRNQKSQCSQFVTQSNDSFYEANLWGDAENPPRAFIHVLKDGDKRIGTVCMLDEVTSPNRATVEEKQALLRDLAAEAERQLEERKAIVERTAHLEHQIQLAKESVDDILVSQIQHYLANREAQKADFETFDEITRSALEKTSPNVFYCGLHLVPDSASLLVLSGKVRDNEEEIPRFQLRNQKSQCSHFVRETEDTFYEAELWCDSPQPPRAFIHVVKDEEGQRIGTVCMLDEVTSPSRATIEEKESLLKELAAQAERQIQERNAIVKRTALLEHQIQLAKESVEDVLVSQIFNYISNRKSEVEGFESFDRITFRGLDRSTASIFYCGIHLVPDHRSILVLSGKVRGNEERIPRFQLRNEKSQCSYFVRERRESYYEENLWCDYLNPPLACIHVLRDDEGRRIGTVCMLEDKNQANSASADEKRLLLRELADEAERLIAESQSALQRTASVEREIQLATDSVEDVLISQIHNYVTRHGPNPSEVARKRTLVEEPSSAQSQRADGLEKVLTRSTKRPRLESSSGQDMLVSEEAQRSLAGLTDCRDIVVRENPRPPTPVSLPDLSSTPDDVYLLSMTPGCPIASRIKKIVEMTARISDYPVAMLVFNDRLASSTTGRSAKRENALDALNAWFRVASQDDARVLLPFERELGRSMCKFPMLEQTVVVVADSSTSSRFRWLYEATGLKAYVGCPLIDSGGRTIANLCIFDRVPRRDLSPMIKAQIEQSGYILCQELQNWTLRIKMERLERDRTVLQSAVTVDRSQPPEKEAVIVITDIEGSTALWEMDAAAMKCALDVHDGIIRQCYCKRSGYEIRAEGDSFTLAFKDPADAVAFALEAQLRLQDAPWPARLLDLPPTEERKGSFRGLRVRMGIAYGHVQTRIHELSQRMVYSGEACNLCKGLEEMAHGGQIVTTIETWNKGFFLGSSSLGDSQLVDLGSHVLRCGESWNAGVVVKNIVQITPSRLSVDYGFSRRPHSSLPDQTDALSTALTPGRQFPPLRSIRQIGPSFHDAPRENSEVAMMFLSATAVERACDNGQDMKMYLSSLIEEVLVTFGSGYHCKELMIAFSKPEEAIQFSFKFFSMLRSREADGSLATPISHLVKFGCVFGQFLTMSPNKLNGRADYFGNVVNRAARVAQAARPGATVLGERTVPGRTTPSTELSSAITPSLTCVTRLKGVGGELSLFECTPSAISTRGAPDLIASSTHTVSSVDIARPSA